MHCNACILLTESELLDHPKISHAKSSLKNRTVELTADFGDASLEDIAEELTALLEKHGYKIATSAQHKERGLKEFTVALPIALGFIALFVLLQKLGIINLVNTENVSFGTAFFIGVVASLSSCMAVVGGLLLSMSATFAQQGQRATPQILFHLGRVVSFFFLGGLIGSVGASLQLGMYGMFALTLIIGIVMLILGINLLDVFHFTKRLQPSMPKFLSRHALGLSKMNHTLTPALVGVATFFLPCGFTQSMQIYTLSTGSFLKGALTMLFFALGTLPVLALVSMSSISITKSPKSGIFFKTAGLIVIIFAVFNILNSFVAIGLLPPLFNL